MIRNLVDKETAITDLIHDYRIGGHRIIDQFEKARDDLYKRQQAEEEKNRIELLKELKAVQEMCSGLVDEGDQSVANIRSELEARHRKIDESIAAALVLC